MSHGFCPISFLININVVIGQCHRDLLLFLLIWFAVLFFSVKVKGTMSSETRREALTQLNTMEVVLRPPNI